MDKQITIFKVYDVEPEKLDLSSNKNISLKTLFDAKLNSSKDLRVEAASGDPVSSDTISNIKIRLGTKANGLFSACSTAYSNHIKLSLSPDDFKLAILQGFAAHINQNSEEFRDKFVSHQDKKEILVRRDDFVFGSANNPWSEVFSEFADKIKEELKDAKLVELVQSPISTSTPVEIAAFNVALMDTVQSYFSFRFKTCCGIPSIELRGTIDDWEKLIELVMHISTYNLSWWTDKLYVILTNIIDAIAYPNDIDLKFWKDIVKVNGGSGGPYYNGWICHLFPYLKDERSSFSVKNSFDYSKNFGGGISADEIPIGISKVPVKWEYFEEEHNMVFTSGFYGYLYDTETHTISPEISWLIYEDKQ